MAAVQTTPGERIQTHGWQGDYYYLLGNLIKKDFKVRYRNMSLGVLWSLANPLIMMGVLTFVFSRIFRNDAIRDFPLFFLSGLVPFNFFTVAWLVGSTSLLDSSTLIKRVPFPREIVPISAVAGNCVHFLIQFGLLILFVLAFGKSPNVYWLWLPVVMGLEVVFVCGLALIFAPLDVYVRDVRYIVESANTVLFWLVPIIYPFEIIPAQYNEIYQYNPVAAVVLAFRKILLDAQAPPSSLLVKLALSSTVMLALGLLTFRRLRRRLYDHL